VLSPPTNDEFEKEVLDELLGQLVVKFVNETANLKSTNGNIAVKAYLE